MKTRNLRSVASRPFYGLYRLVLQQRTPQQSGQLIVRSQMGHMVQHLPRSVMSNAMLT